MKALLKTIIIVLCNATDVWGQGRLDVVLNHSMTTEKLNSNYGISKVVYAGAKGDTLGKFGWIDRNGFMNLIAPSGIEKMCMSYYENRLEPNDSSVILVINYLEIKTDKTERSIRLQCGGSFSYCILIGGKPFVIQELDTTIKSSINSELKHIEGSIRNLLDVIALQIESGRYAKPTRKFDSDRVDLSIPIPRFITDSTKVVGFYKSFNELASNAPSITDTYTHEIRSHKHVFYEKGSKRRFDKFEYFGYSDGDWVYINAMYYRQARELKVVQGKGPVVWWYDPVDTPDLSREMIGPGPVGSIGGLGILISPGTPGFYLDLRNGKLYAMTIENMNTLISTEPELLNEYEFSDRKKSYKVITEFLERYNTNWCNTYIEKTKP